LIFEEETKRLLPPSLWEGGRLRRGMGKNLKFQFSSSNPEPCRIQGCPISFSGIGQFSINTQFREVYQI